MSTTTVIGDLITALVAQSTTALPAVTVTDGYGTSGEPGDYLMIGVDDPDAGDDATSATSVQEWANTTGGARREMGDVTCVALSWNGDSDAKAARDGALAIANAVQLLVRPAGRAGDLGVAGVQWLSYGTQTRLLQQSDDAGAVAKVIFTVHFQARL